MKNLLILFAFTGLLTFGQTPSPSPLPVIPLPSGVAIFGEFNQLGTPRFTVGISALYPYGQSAGNVGIYGSTTADVSPVHATDPTTGRKFYAVSAAVRQGVHKDIFDSGKFSFLLGGDVGPSLSSSNGSTLVNFSTSFVATGLYQASPAVSVIVPVRMLYIANAGWNPVLEAGIVINLGKLPAPASVKALHHSLFTVSR
jgi:hypothetical protein